MLEKMAKICIQYARTLFCFNINKLIPTSAARWRRSHIRGGEVYYRLRSLISLHLFLSSKVFFLSMNHVYLSIISLSLSCVYNKLLKAKCFALNLQSSDVDKGCTNLYSDNKQSLIHFLLFLIMTIWIYSAPWNKYFSSWTDIFFCSMKIYSCSLVFYQNVISSLKKYSTFLMYT